MDTVKICGVKAKVAKTLFERMKGLIGTKCLRPGEGMLILKCNSIHTRSGPPSSGRWDTSPVHMEFIRLRIHGNS